MKTKLLGFVALFLVLSVASAYSADWKLIGYGMSQNGKKQFDSYVGNSERTAEGTIKIHVKQIYTPIGIKEMRDQLPNCSYSVFTVEISCSTEELRVMNMADFNKDDKMLKFYKQSELDEGNWGKIDAGTLAEIYFEDFCGKKLNSGTK
ncbi:MAG: hypothetical protein JW795_04520 [Chitinivibrionales bacterium]|nr:hypothetical protein [Chitinivibrionales bacterium]